MASPVQSGLVVADLDRFDEDERHKHELIGGMLFVSPKGVPRHQLVATRIARRLLDHTDVHGGVAIVEPDVYYTERDFVVPDVVLLSAEAWERVGVTYIDVPPDLVAEVSSPSTRRRDLTVKRELYEQQGVPEYWFVDLDSDRIEVYRLPAADRVGDVPAGTGYGAPLLVGRGEQVRPPHVPGLAVGVDDVLGAVQPPGWT
jgi:Uma2 family endonuclease